MSVRKSPYIKTALFEKTNVDAVTTHATGGVFLDHAGLRTPYPFLIIEKVIAMPHGTFGVPSAIEESYWHLKAFAEAKSSQSAQEQGEEIIDAALGAIGLDLTLSNGTCRSVRWDSDLPTLKQPVPNKIVYMTAVRLKIWVANETTEVETFYTTFDGNRQTFNGNPLTFGA